MMQEIENENTILIENIMLCKIGLLKELIHE